MMIVEGNKNEQLSSRQQMAIFDVHAIVDFSRRSIYMYITHTVNRFLIESHLSLRSAIQTLKK